ncbi:hypothetical protein FK220_012215 [Flavobacteriaceae bacterium TP-CH-4]|uniref:WD40-like Beta Propeller Repeat n=1 Tax=Pelagihabitans pacificus TaxID=2696054 RepID=A0A967ATN8_9FLAO|nr:putative Ig domain-containing protein [Pelagihabitans pacificus]NHF60113.1 hypothetical protein [Pelagihabitans pacificus]
MIKRIIPFLTIIAMMGCKTNNGINDYFGQSEPETTPIVFGADSISLKGRFEHGISFTPDARELAFGILGGNAVKGKIYYSKKIDGQWATPKDFNPLKNESVFLPYFTPDGKSLLYTQSIPDTDQLYITDIWKLDKINGDWDFPKKIPTPLSSKTREATASMTYDGTIYFSSNRNCQGKENCYTADLFYSKLVDNEYQNVKEISKLNSSNDEESVFISPKEEYILFCRYTDNETFVDLYISYRDHNNHWTEPQLLDATINSKDWDRRPFVSIDNKFLFFTRLEIEENKLTESDIYWVNTTKVFKPFVNHPIPDITLQVDEKFEVQIPADYFKDIDDNQLTLTINQNEFNWLEFDGKKMKLSGLPTLEGNFELIFTAVDQFSNRTRNSIKVTVKK